MRKWQKSKQKKNEPPLAHLPSARMLPSSLTMFALRMRLTQNAPIGPSCPVALIT
jgi:hypothetical protein